MNPQAPRPERAQVLAGSPTRFATTLVVALLATAPGLHDALRGGEPLPAAAGRFLVAFGVLWVLGGIAAVLLRRPAGERESLEMPEMVPGTAGTDR
jgi:hypothetical protein